MSKILETLKLDGILLANGNGETILSTELVDIINAFRDIEGNRKILKHKTCMEKIRKEIETLASLGLEGEQNFLPSSYINSQNKEQPCFELNKNGMLSILNSESVLVRYKTIELIEKLQEENKQLKSDNESLHQIAISEEEQAKRIYEADRVKYSIHNIEGIIKDSDYTNIKYNIDKIIDVHSNLYVCDRNEPYKNIVKYGNRGSSLYVNHVKSFIEKKLDKLRPEKCIECTHISSVMIEMARDIRKDVESSRNITDGRTIAKLGKEINKLKNESEVC